MSDDATLDEFVDMDGDKPEELEKPELIQGVAWSTIESTPKEWIVNNVESDIEILSGNNFSSEYFVEEGGIPLIRIRDLAEDDTTINFEGDYDSKYLINQQDLLVGMDGEFEPHLWKGPQALLNQRVCKIEPKNKYNKIFFRYAIEKPLFYIQKSIAGTTVKHLSQSNINDLNLLTPPLPEQRKIATVLYTIDQEIEKTKEIKNQKQKVRSSIRDNLISEHSDSNTKSTQTGPLSLNIPRHWEVRNLKEFITEFVNGATISPNDFSPEGIEVIPKKGITSSGVLDVEPEKRQYCSKEFADSNSTNVIDSDYLLTTLKDLNQKGPSIGRIVDIDSNNGYPEGDRYLLAQGVFGLKTNKQIHDEYLIELSNSTWYRKYMKSILVGSTQVHIRNPIFLGIKIPYPPIEEQKEIATKLRALSKDIEIEENYEKRLIKLKKGLQQDLLSGTVRTTDTNIEVPDEIAQHG